MVFEPTMTPPPPKNYFPVAETEPPSSPLTITSQTTDTTVSPSINIQYGKDIRIKINYHVENPSTATPSSHIHINITVPTPVPSVYHQSPPTLSTNTDFSRTPAPAVETPIHHNMTPPGPPVENPSHFIPSHDATMTPAPPVENTVTTSLLSPKASPFAPSSLFTPRRHRRPYRKRIARLGKTSITTPETYHPVNRVPTRTNALPPQSTLPLITPQPKLPSNPTTGIVPPLSYKEALSPHCTNPSKLVPPKI